MITPQKSIKKRLFSEIEQGTSDLFSLPLDDRYSSVIMATHNDLIKEPITLKRAPINNEIIEELELLRINYKGMADE